VLIGKPAHVEGDDKIETLLEQLRQRQLSNEQLETFERRKEAAKKLQELKAAEAQADMQTSLTNAQMEARIAENHGEADLARARKRAEQAIVVAEAHLGRSRREAEQKIVLAEAESRASMLAGRGESQRLMQIGLSESSVLARKVNSFGDPRLFALSVVADRLANSKQPLVPQRLFVTGGGGHGNANGDSGTNPQTSGLIGALLAMLVAEKSGFPVADMPEPESLKRLIEDMTNESLESIKHVTAHGKTEQAKT
jgi:hypothetical protein